MGECLLQSYKLPVLKFSQTNKIMDDDDECDPRRRRTKATCTSSDLHVAIYSRNIPVVNQCVKNKAIINSFWRGCTPVSSALYLKRYNIMQILVNNGVNVNLCTHNSKMEPPLFAACRLRDKTAINILLTSNDLKIDQQDFFGRTALWAAARYSSADVVEQLLNRGAKLNMNYDCPKKHPINGALQQTGRNAKGVIHLLVHRGSFLDSVCEESPLKWAVEHADRDTFCLFISAGCKIKSENWMSYDKLPTSWQQDSSFYNWIEFLKSNPAPLRDITACLIRNVLIKKWKSLQPQHVNNLHLPDSLTSLILLNNI